jgi:diguanylate cyclase (GGDEF)-like protein
MLLRQSNEGVDHACPGEEFVNRKRPAQTLPEYSERIATLVRTQAKITAPDLSLEDATRLVVESGKELTGARTALIRFVEGDRLVCRAATEHSRYLIGDAIKMGRALSNSISAAEVAVLCADTELDSRINHESSRRHGTRSLISVPMRHHGELVAVLRLYSPDPGQFNQQDLAIAQLLAGMTGSEIQRRRSEGALEASERFARMTLDALTKHICVLEENGVIIAVNRAWREFAAANGGMPLHTGMGANYLDVCDAATGPEAADARTFADGARAVLAGRQATFAMEYPCHSPVEKRWFQVRVTRFNDAGPVRVVVAHENITERKQAEERRHTYAQQQSIIAAFGQEALSSTDLDALNERAVACVGEGLKVEFCALMHTSPDGGALTLNAGLGWDADCIGRSVPVDAAQYCFHAFAAGVTPGEMGFGDVEHSAVYEILRSHGIKSGTEVPIAGSGGMHGVLGAFSRERRHFTAEDNVFLNSIANILETALERKSAEEKLAHLAQFDTLSGLPNRNLFNDRLAHTLTQAIRNRRLTGVLMVDLDRFKLVNDTRGHIVGDQLLVQVAARLKQCVRSGDTVARLGGDEFAVVLADLARADDAGLVAAKIVDACAGAFDLQGETAFISASVGISLCPEDGSDPGVLLKNADIAMYRAKEQGRNGYQFYLPQMHEKALARMRMEAQLRSALERGEFLLHYQPKADLQSGAISGFEALLRWQHPERGLVPPIEFISVLEDTGLIVQVGEWVLRTACRQLKTWQDQGIGRQSIAVNLSARQFQQKNLDVIVASMLAETGANPQLLEIELTESLLMNDAEDAVRVLRELKSVGVRLSVDDFGTGYSSLAYLKRFPLDTLKIDRAFIRDCIADPGDATIALAIINLAHNLKLKVVAEGVETQAQLDFLRSHGCDQMQGYFFSRPLQVDDATQALTDAIRLRIDDGDEFQGLQILLVDDNDFDLELFREALQPDGYRILTARNPEMAFGILASREIGIVISDQNMPMMSGVKFLAAVRKLYPRALRVMLTGGDSPETMPHAVNEAGIHKLLSKHWDEERLRQEVREARALVRPAGK